MIIYSHSLQGKRESNEDQHVTLLNLDNIDKNLNSINFFGVFDGHGGKIVSKYLKDNLPKHFLVKFNKNIIDKKKKMKSYINQIYDLIQNINRCKNWIEILKIATNFFETIGVMYFNYTKNGLGKVTIIIIFFIYQFIYIKNLRLQILFMIL